MSTHQAIALGVVASGLIGALAPFVAVTLVFEFRARVRKRRA